MEATFFICRRERALGVRDIDGLPAEPVGEPLRGDATGALFALVGILTSAARGAIQPLRDATCQSFPVWSFAPEVVDALVAMSDPDIDRVAQAWLENETSQELDADAYELSLLLGELRQELSARDDSEMELFVLLEEKAL